MRYLITFACYGNHLHGDDRGSVDRGHNQPGTRLVTPQPALQAHQRLISHPPYTLDPPRREAVLQSIQEVCHHRTWTLYAAHIRTNHVHAIIEAEVPLERIMNTLKSYATRALNNLGLDDPNQKRWTRHGSTRWLKSDPATEAAIRYVVEEQGDPMSVFLSDSIHRSRIPAASKPPTPREISEPRLGVPPGPSG